MCLSLAGGSRRIPFRCKNQALRAAALLLRSCRRCVAVAVWGQIRQRERTLWYKQDHKDEEEQEDHVKVKRDQDGGKLGQDQVKLSQDNAEPDHEDDVHVTSARTGGDGLSIRQSTFRRCQGEPVEHRTGRPKANCENGPRARSQSPLRNCVGDWKRPSSLSQNLYMYIYIYMYIHIYTHILYFFWDIFGISADQFSAYQAGSEESPYEGGRRCQGQEISRTGQWKFQNVSDTPVN